MSAQEEIKMWKTAAEKWRKNYDTAAARIAELEGERERVARLIPEWRKAHKILPSAVYLQCAESLAAALDRGTG